VRALLVVALLALTGCATVKGWLGMDGEPEPKPVKVEQSASPSDLTKLGDKLDKSDSRVAAAVTVAVENKDKPGVVEAEGNLALSYLPKPTEGDLAFARQRAAAANPAAYVEQSKFARTFLAQMEKEWKDAGDKAKKNADDLTAALTRINELTAEVAKVRKESAEAVRKVEAEASRNVWTIAGVGLAVIGALCTAFLGPKVGLPLIASGALLGSVPFIYASPWFAWVMGGTLAFCGAMLGWYVWDKVRDAVNKSDDAA
jgi:hypothetical protein